MNEQHVPARVYVHTGGFDEVFGGRKSEAFDYFSNSLENIRSAIWSGNISPTKPRYMIATLWGNVKSGEKNADVFVYGDLTNWRDNPEFAAGVFANGKLIADKRGVVGCGDALIMLGCEETLRRTTRDLAEYLEQPPAIEDHRSLWVP